MCQNEYQWSKVLKLRMGIETFLKFGNLLVQSNMVGCHGQITVQSFQVTWSNIIDKFKDGCIGKGRKSRVTLF